MCQRERWFVLKYRKATQKRQIQLEAKTKIQTQYESQHVRSLCFHIPRRLAVFYFCENLNDKILTAIY